MASIIERDDGRFEIRESIRTADGPRSRTLAIFRALSSEGLDHAEARASRPFDREAVREEAVERGVPWVGTEVASSVREVLAAVEDGTRPPPVLAVVLREVLDEHAAEELPDSIPPVLEWIGRSDTDRGRALRDLLRLADRLGRSGRRAREDLCYPRVSSAGAA